MTSQDKIRVLADLGRFDTADLMESRRNLPLEDNGEGMPRLEEETILKKVHILGAAGKYDVCASTASPRKELSQDRIGHPCASGICQSYTPDGRCISLFKTLYTNKCSFDCTYCTNSTSCTKGIRGGHYSYKPSELAKVFMGLYLRNYVEGLFLSSGVPRDVDKTMEDILEAIRYLRETYKFRGYIHLKILPGASYEHIKQAVEWADRVSINLEAPSKSRLSEISGNKDYRIDILRRQAWIQRLHKRGLLPASQTTQFIVGAGEETDLEILSRLKWEYTHIGLKRGYFTAFDPVPGTPLEAQDTIPLWREHRLYQADWLMRIYDFKFIEVKQVLTEDGFLSNNDPKKLLAERTLDRPIDINEGTYTDLLRVPGIGPKSAARIIRLRDSGEKISSHKQLHDIGVVLRRADPFIVVKGKGQKTLLKWWK